VVAGQQSGVRTLLRAIAAHLARSGRLGVGRRVLARVEVQTLANHLTRHVAGALIDT
jgi:hypothetical protein